MRLKTVKYFMNLAQKRSVSSGNFLHSNFLSSNLADPLSRNQLVTNLVKRLDLSSEEAESRIKHLHNLFKRCEADDSGTNLSEFAQAAKELPNLTHPDVIGLTEPKVLQPCKHWQHNLPKIRPFDEIAKSILGARWDNAAVTATERSYYLMGDLAELEQALIRYTVASLTKQFGFKMMSVPDLLHPSVLEDCGMDTEGAITQVYRLDPRYHNSTALSGTAEMAIGGYFKNKTIDFTHYTDPVVRVAAVSRCYRAESTGGLAGNGIYRVHHFTKVEMFAVTINNIELSSRVHEEFLDIQKTLFSNLGLLFQVLDMPPNDLGSPAYRKYDIEALLPGRVYKPVGSQYAFGEISSTSNCTDYQSRRLNIQTSNGDFPHTVNGTACAVPRMIMAICEQFQTPNGCVKIPKALLPYFSLPRPDELLKAKPKSKRLVLKHVRSSKFYVQKFNEKKSEKTVKV